MVGAKVPGCSNCGKTSHGGTTRDLTVEGPDDRYEVRVGDVPVGRFRSVVAAVTFSKGHQGATVHTLKP